MVAGRIAGRLVAQRMPAERLLLLALVVAAAGFFVSWLAPVALVAVLDLFLAGIGVANLYPLTVALAIGAAPGQRPGPPPESGTSRGPRSAMTAVEGDKGDKGVELRKNQV
jgi:MFS family permease